MSLEQIHAVIAHAPPDFSLPHQVMQVRQRFPGGEKELMGVALALEKPSEHIDPGHRPGGNR